MKQNSYIIVSGYIDVFNVLSNSDSDMIPKNLKAVSCLNNQAILVWPSGINSSLVGNYSLEYKKDGEEWKKELIKNPGRVTLVQTTLDGLESGVVYKFRLQPDSDIALPKYARTECTVESELGSKM